MTDELDYTPAVAAWQNASAAIEQALSVADAGRAEARTALQAGKPVFAALGGQAWYDSACVVLEAAASGAAIGATFGPVGAVVGGTLGALGAALTQPAVGTVTLSETCYLPDGTKVEGQQASQPPCLCYQQHRAVALNEAEASEKFAAWWAGKKRKIAGEWIWVAGYPWERKVGIAPKLDEQSARSWWEQHRRNETREAIVAQCLPRYESTAAARAVAEQLFDGRWGDRWYFGDEELFSVAVRQFPAWVPVSASLVSKWLLLAASLGLAAADVERVALLSDPRLGVAPQGATLEKLDPATRRAVAANSIVLVLARSGGVVAVAETGLALLDDASTSAGLDFADVGDADIAAAWQRLATPGVSYVASSKRSLWWWAAGVVVVVVLVRGFRRTRKRRGR